MLDPHATAIVYRAATRIHRSIGLDVTCQVRLSAAEAHQRFRADLLQPVLDWAEVWFQNTDTITFHDPLAAATIFDDQICTFEKGWVDVELASPRLHGLTYWDPGAAHSRHEVAVAVNPEHFFEHYFTVF